MFYREAGQFKTSYKQYMQAFPIREDRIGIAIWLAIALFLRSLFWLAGVGIYLCDECDHDPCGDFYNHRYWTEYFGWVYRSD